MKISALGNFSPKLFFVPSLSLNLFRYYWYLFFVLLLLSAIDARAAFIFKPIPCATWLQATPAMQVEQDVLTESQAQGLRYLRRAYYDHLLLGKTFILPAARAALLANHWPKEQAYVDDFLPTIRAAITSHQWPKQQVVDDVLQEAEHDLLELTGGELLLTRKLFQQLDQQIDCLRQRSQPAVLEIRQRIDRLLLNLQDEQVDLWPDSEKRSTKWPSCTNGHQFTMAIRTFLLNVQRPIIILTQHIQQDNLITLTALMEELQAIEKALAFYPRFMTEYLRTHPN